MNTVESENAALHAGLIKEAIERQIADTDLGEQLDVVGSVVGGGFIED